MGETRYPSRPERTEALGHLRLLMVVGAAVVVLAVFRGKLERWAVDYIAADTVSRIIDITFAVLGLLAVVQIVIGLWRGFRWSRARHFERMLEDPARSADVPPLEDHVKALRWQFLNGRPFLRGCLAVAVVKGAWRSPWSWR